MKDMSKYFGTGVSGLSTVPGDANLMGFVIIGGGSTRNRKANHIPFQYIEKVPNWSKEAVYEDNQIPGRFETQSNYSHSNANNVDMQLLYYAEADDPYDEILGFEPDTGNKKKLRQDLNVIQKDFVNIKNASQDFQGDPNLSLNSYVQGRLQLGSEAQKQRLNEFLNPKPKPATHWTVQKIEFYIARLKSLLYPEYDGNYTPPRKVLLNIGETYWDFPVIIKSIGIEHESPFDIKRMTSRFFKVNLTLASSYPLYQAISASQIRTSMLSEGNKVFAQKSFSITNTLVREE